MNDAVGYEADKVVVTMNRVPVATDSIDVALELISRITKSQRFDSDLLAGMDVH